MIVNFTDLDVQRFWARVEKKNETECWHWTGGTAWGYGRLSTQDRKPWRAHRFSYVLAHGPFDPDLVVMHICDQRSCVNPAHLQLGTQADNMADMVKKGRSSLRERNHNVVLIDDQIHEIVQRRIGGETLASLSAAYGVSDVTLLNIFSGKRSSPNGAGAASIPKLRKHNRDRKLTEEDAGEIVKRRAAGEPLAIIAGAYGITYAYAGTICNGRAWPHIFGKNGVPTLDAVRAVRTKGPRLSKATRNAIFEAFASGKTAKEVAEAFDVGLSSVYYISSRP